MTYRRRESSALWLEDDHLEWEQAAGGVEVTPAMLSPVTSWLRNTATSGGVASVADMLSAGNPATQSTSGNRPTGATSSNGLPVLSFDGTDDFLSVPLHSGNNGSPRWGWAAWIRPATVTGVHTLIGGTTTGGASASKLLIQQNATDLFVNVYHSNFVVRRATAGNILALNTWVFATVEFDGAQSSEAEECIITIDGVAQTLAFANDSGTPNDMPDTLVQPTGSMAIGDSRISSPLQPWNGLIGMNQYILAGAGGISGGGLLTASERNILRLFERPT